MKRRLAPDEKWTERLKSDTSITLFAEDIDTGKVVGIVGVYWKNDRVKHKHVAEIGPVYIDPEWRGRKIGHELLQTAIQRCKSTRHISKINIGVNTKQKSAYNLYIKCGFKLVGVLHKELFIENKYYDECLMEMILRR